MRSDRIASGTPRREISGAPSLRVELALVAGTLAAALLLVQVAG